VASVDAQAITRTIYPDRYGVHRCATFGDLRERIKDLAILLGYTLVEEDR